MFEKQQPDWDTQAGQALRQIAKTLAESGVSQPRPIVVFGSAPLQIFIDPDLLSADIDLFVRDNAL